MTIITQNQLGLKTSSGGVYAFANPAISVSNSTTYSEFSGKPGLNFSLLENNTSDISMPTDGRITYMGLATKRFKVTCFVCGSSNNTSSQMAMFKLVKNGVDIPNAVFLGQSPNTTGFTAMAPILFLDLNTNDYVSIFYKSNVSTGVMYLSSANITLESDT